MTKNILLYKFRNSIPNIRVYVEGLMMLNIHSQTGFRGRCAAAFHHHGLRLERLFLNPEPAHCFEGQRHLFGFFHCLPPTDDG